MLGYPCGSAWCDAPREERRLSVHAPTTTPSRAPSARALGRCGEAEPLQPQLLAASRSPGAAAVLPGRNVRLFAFCWLHGVFGLCMSAREKARSKQPKRSARMRVCTYGCAINQAALGLI